MSKSRRLKPHERYILRKLGYNPKYFLFLDKTYDNYSFIEVTSGKVLDIKF